MTRTIGSTAADLIIERIADRIPGWDVRREGAAWIADNPDEDWPGMWVMVDATVRIVTPAEELPHASHLGPIVAGGNRGIETRIQLPAMIDSTDMWRAINALVAAGALPDENGMVR